MLIALKAFDNLKTKNAEIVADTFEGIYYYYLFYPACIEKKWKWNQKMIFKKFKNIN